MRPFASVAMLEKLALLAIARCRASVFNSAAACDTKLASAPGTLSSVGGICVGRARKERGARVTGRQEFHNRRPGGLLLNDLLVSCGSLRSQRSLRFLPLGLLRDDGHAAEGGHEGPRRPGNGHPVLHEQLASG